MVLICGKYQPPLPSNKGLVISTSTDTSTSHRTGTTEGTEASYMFPNVGGGGSFFDYSSIEQLKAPPLPSSSSISSSSAFSSSTEEDAEEEEEKKKQLVQLLLPVLDEQDQVEDTSDATDKKALKRMRHRQAMARFRLKKKQILLRMRQEVNLLEKKLAFCTLRSTLSSMNTKQELIAFNDGKLTATQKYTQIVQLKERLLQEHQHLRMTIESHEKFHQILRTSSATTTTISASDSLSSYEKAEEQEKGIQYTPKSVLECTKIIRNAYQRTLLFTQMLEKNHLLTQIASVMGWHSQRYLSLDRTTLKFKFTRLYEDTRPETLANQTWEIYHVSSQFKRMYSTVMNMKVLQKVDTNTSIIMRNLPDVTGQLDLRCIYLASRLTLPGNQGTMILAESINPSATDMKSVGERNKKKSIKWIECFNWVVFSSPPDKPNATLVEYNGQVNCISEEMARFMLVEIMCILLRWEHMVVEPLFLKFT